MRVERRIRAPIEDVFHTVADIREFAKVIPEIVDVDFLTPKRVGVGAKFRETREMRGREVTTELEVTEYVPNELIRFVSVAGGAEWDSLFSFREEGEETVLVLDMDARPLNVLARLTTPLMRGVVKGALERDMDAVKVYCEQGAGTPARAG